MLSRAPNQSVALDGQQDVLDTIETSTMPSIPQNKGILDFPARHHLRSLKVDVPDDDATMDGGSDSLNTFAGTDIALDTPSPAALYASIQSVVVRDTVASALFTGSDSGGGNNSEPHSPASAYSSPFITLEASQQLWNSGTRAASPAGHIKQFIAPAAFSGSPHRLASAAVGSPVLHFSKGILECSPPDADDVKGRKVVEAVANPLPAVPLPSSSCVPPERRRGSSVYRKAAVARYLTGRKTMTQDAPVDCMHESDSHPPSSAHQASMAAGLAQPHSPCSDDEIQLPEMEHAVAVSDTLGQFAGKSALGRGTIHDFAVWYRGDEEEQRQETQQDADVLRTYPAADDIMQFDGSDELDRCHSQPISGHSSSLTADEASQGSWLDMGSPRTGSESFAHQTAQDCDVVQQDNQVTCKGGLTYCGDSAEICLQRPENYVPVVMADAACRDGIHCNSHQFTGPGHPGMASSGGLSCLGPDESRPEHKKISDKLKRGLDHAAVSWSHHDNQERENNAAGGEQQDTCSATPLKAQHLCEPSLCPVNGAICGKKRAAEYGQEIAPEHMSEMKVQQTLNCNQNPGPSPPYIINGANADALHMIHKPATSGLCPPHGLHAALPVDVNEAFRPTKEQCLTSDNVEKQCPNPHMEVKQLCTAAVANSSVNESLPDNQQLPQKPSACIFDAQSQPTPFVAAAAADHDSPEASMCAPHCAPLRAGDVLVVGNTTAVDAPEGCMFCNTLSTANAEDGLSGGSCSADEVHSSGSSTSSYCSSLAQDVAAGIESAVASGQLPRMDCAHAKAVEADEGQADLPNLQQNAASNDDSIESVRTSSSVSTNAVALEVVPPSTPPRVTGSPLTLQPSTSLSKEGLAACAPQTDTAPAMAVEPVVVTSGEPGVNEPLSSSAIKNSMMAWLGETSQKMKLLLCFKAKNATATPSTSGEAVEKLHPPMAGSGQSGRISKAEPEGRSGCESAQKAGSFWVTHQLSRAVMESDENEGLFSMVAATAMQLRHGPTTRVSTAAASQQREFNDGACTSGSADPSSRRSVGADKERCSKGCQQVQTKDFSREGQHLKDMEAPCGAAASCSTSQELASVVIPAPASQEDSVDAPSSTAAQHVSNTNADRSQHQVVVQQADKALREGPGLDDHTDGAPGLHSAVQPGQEEQHHGRLVETVSSIIRRNLAGLVLDDADFILDLAEEQMHCYDLPAVVGADDKPQGGGSGGRVNRAARDKPGPVGCLEDWGPSAEDGMERQGGQDRGDVSQASSSRASQQPSAMTTITTPVEKPTEGATGAVSGAIQRAGQTMRHVVQQLTHGGSERASATDQAGSQGSTVEPSCLMTIKDYGSDVSLPAACAAAADRVLSGLHVPEACILGDLQPDVTRPEGTRGDTPDLVGPPNEGRVRGLEGADLVGPADQQQQEGDVIEGPGIVQPSHDVLDGTANHVPEPTAET